MKLEHLISIGGAILVVYRNGEGDYRYEIVFWDGTLYQPDELYQTSNRAKAVGIESIKIVIGY